jgi:hypothetical protein
LPAQPPPLDTQPRETTPAADRETAAVTDREITLAMRRLNLAGVRILPDRRIGIWPDLDCPEVYSALKVVGMVRLPTVNLESADVPVRYKVRACPARFLGESFAAWLRRAEKAQPSLVAAYAEGNPA